MASRLPSVVVGKDCPFFFSVRSIFIFIFTTANEKTITLLGKVNFSMNAPAKSNLIFLTVFYFPVKITCRITPSVTSLMCSP